MAKWDIQVDSTFTVTESYITKPETTASPQPYASLRVHFLLRAVRYLLAKLQSTKTTPTSNPKLQSIKRCFTFLLTPTHLHLSSILATRTTQASTICLSFRTETAQNQISELNHLFADTEKLPAHRVEEIHTGDEEDVLHLYLGDIGNEVDVKACGLFACIANLFRKRKRGAVDSVGGAFYGHPTYGHELGALGNSVTVSSGWN